MKGRFLKLLSLFIILTISLASCTKEGTDLGKFNLSYGVIVGTNPDYSVKLDNGTTLTIRVNRVPQIVVRDGQRVLVDYTVLEDEAKSSVSALPGTQPVILNYIYDILAKNVIMSSAVNTVEKNDSIGHDYINVLDSWVGSKYLNIHFEVLRENPVTKHMISLVYDEERSTATDKYFTLRHNAFGDRRAYSSFGRVSFNIENILSTISNGSNVKLHLEWKSDFYGDQSKTIVLSNWFCD
jgi:hypothetical protein